MVCISQLLAEKRSDLSGWEKSPSADANKLENISSLKKQITELERELNSHG